MTVAARVRALSSDPRLLAGLVACSLACIAIVATLVTRRVLRSTLQTASAFNGTVPGNGDPVVVKAGQLPGLLNGTEFGYSFWIFVQASAPTVAERSVLTHPAGTGVAVTLDRDANALSFRLPGATVVPRIKYIPMARWVHIVAVYAGGGVTFYLDGEVHSVHAVDVPMNFAGPSGDMTIGGGSSLPDATGFSGYVGYVSYLNFHPSVGLVKRLYAAGPATRRGFFSAFGMHGYGVRSPLYRLNTVRPVHGLDTL